MSAATLWAWDDTNNEWVKIKTDDQGRLYTVAVIDHLDDIGDVEAAAPGDGEALVWDNAAGDWVPGAPAPGAHKDTHDPEDGSDKLDTAAPVQVGEANAIGTSHSFPRADHVHKKHHAKYTDAAAKAAAVQAGAITDGVTKAPTHDAVYDVKTTADLATTPAEVATLITTHTDDPDAHHSEEIPDGRGLYNATKLLMLPGVSAGGGGTVAFVKDLIHYFAIKPTTPITIDQVTIEVTAAAGGGEKCRIAIYEADINWQPGDLVVASAEIAIDAIAVVDTAITETTLQEGRYLVALIVEGNVTLRKANVGTFPIIGYKTTLGTVPRVGCPIAAQAYGVLLDPGTAWDDITKSTTYQEEVVFFNVLTP